MSQTFQFKTHEVGAGSHIMVTPNGIVDDRRETSMIMTIFCTIFCMVALVSSVDICDTRELLLFWSKPSLLPQLRLVSTSVFRQHSLGCDDPTFDYVVFVVSDTALCPSCDPMNLTVSWRELQLVIDEYRHGETKIRKSVLSWWTVA